MKRRKILGALGFGSLSALASMNTNANSYTYPEFQTRPHGFDSINGISISTTVLNQPDEEIPGKVEISLKNLGSSSLNDMFGSSPPFSGYSSRESPKMVLIPSTWAAQSFDEQPQSTNEESKHSRHVSVEYEGGCWRTTSPIYNPGAGKFVELQPERKLKEEYYILSSSNSIRCLPDGHYTIYPRDPIYSEGECHISIEAKR